MFVIANPNLTPLCHLRPTDGSISQTAEGSGEFHILSHFFCAEVTVFFFLRGEISMGDLWYFLHVANERFGKSMLQPTLDRGELGAYPLVSAGQSLEHSVLHLIMDLGLSNRESLFLRLGASHLNGSNLR